MLWFLAIMLAILAVVELTYFSIASTFGIVDKPNERSSHTKITLRGGGVIFPIAVLVYFLSCGFNYPWFTLGVAIISLISFCDDIKPLSTKVRLAVHFIALLLMFYQLGMFANALWLLPFLLILCGGVINAYNFMDGINGITGGYSLVVLLGLVATNLSIDNFVDQYFLSSIIASLLIFVFFNFRTKAKCFAGDVGSVSIAFIILFLLGLLIVKTQDFSWICFLLIYGIDSTLTIIHRIMLKENIARPHRKHLYQLLANELKIPQLIVSGIYMLLQASVIAGHILIYGMGGYCTWPYIITVCFAFTIIYILTKRTYYHLHMVESL